MADGLRHFFILRVLFSVTTSCDFQVSFQQRSAFFCKGFCQAGVGVGVGCRDGEVTAAGRIKEFRRSSTEVTQDKTPSVSRKEPLSPPSNAPNPHLNHQILRPGHGRRGGGAGGLFVYVGMSVRLSRVLRPLAPLTLSPSVCCCWSTATVKGSGGCGGGGGATTAGYRAP